MARFDGGWFRFERKTLWGDIGQNPNTLALWMWILGLANVQESSVRFQGNQVAISPGSLVTGIDELVSITKLSASSVRRSLTYLENSGRIRQTVGNQGRLITICKWEQYQLLRLVDDKQTTNDEQTGDNQGANGRHLIEQLNNNTIYSAVVKPSARKRQAVVVFANSEELKQALGNEWFATQSAIYPDEMYRERELKKAFAYYADNKRKCPTTIGGWKRAIASWFDRGWARHQSAIPSQKTSCSDIVER